MPRLLFLPLLLPLSASLDNGAALVPPRGLTTWELFDFAVNASAIEAVAAAMVSSGLVSAGYDILWLDDGWPACDEFSGGPFSSCKTPAPRGPDGRIIPDPLKFPSGLAPVAASLRARGIRMGIYSAPHAATCGGFTGSLGHEAVDAAAWVEWGITAVKMDAGCQDDCSIHDGCLLGSLARMRDGLNATGVPVLYYVDDGNPTTGPRVYNPAARGWPQNAQTATHFARAWAENVVAWGGEIANMYKLWFDRSDRWGSLLDNVGQQANFAWFQRPGAFLAPDQLTIGQGQMTAGEYRAEVFLYAALGAPMFLSAPIDRLSAAELALLTNPELLAVHADADCVMATRVWHATATAGDRWPVETWVRPLADGSFVWTLVNLDPAEAHTVPILFGNGGDWAGSDIFPASIDRGRVRDVAARADIGVFEAAANISVAPHDARLIRVYPEGA